MIRKPRWFATRWWGWLIVGVIGFGLLSAAFPGQVLAGPIVKWWDSFIPSDGLNSSCSALITDPQGNVYAGGSTYHGPYGNRVLAGYIVKYDPRQDWDDRLWEVLQYSEAKALTLDDQGNLYVAMQTATVTTHNDIATVKYDPNGYERWAVQYNNDPVNGNDWPVSLGLDSHGNIYVTGYSAGSGTGDDYCTIKYSQSGGLAHQEWVARYNGPGDGDDQPVGLALDAEGNIYVAGTSVGSGTNKDIAVIKYDPDGKELWKVRYNNDAVNGDDVARGLALDSKGNVYVTGYSAGSGTGDDYCTIKYSQSGGLAHQEWVARYNGPGNGNDQSVGLALDPQGNIYVSGTSENTLNNLSSKDYATVKYDPQGEELWARRYDYQGLRDEAADLKLDPWGNVFVTGRITHANGYDCGTLKYTPEGKEDWVHVESVKGISTKGQHLAVDALGNVFVEVRLYGDPDWDYIIKIGLASVPLDLLLD